MMAGPAGSRRAFTLIEMLIVIGIIGLLAALLLPALSGARNVARKSSCMNNLHQIGVAIYTYANDYDGSIPYGPKAPPFVSPASFYPSTGTVTSLISLDSGQPVALGLLLRQHLSKQPKVLFCPGSDQSVNTDAELARVGFRQAQCSYYYRHGSGFQLFDPRPLPSPDHIQLCNLGTNRNGRPIRALVMDAQFLCPADLASFNVKPSTHHGGQFTNILFSDGQVVSRSNSDGRFTVDVRDYSQVRQAFDRILTALERADEE
jgi:prepilin-type N-terminal cleavage/methylation domain-containing protein/prepilin-type processing-associated H-X9-DG protein